MVARPNIVFVLANVGRVGDGRGMPGPIQSNDVAVDIWKIA